MLAINGEQSKNTKKLVGLIQLDVRRQTGVPAIGSNFRQMNQIENPFHKDPIHINKNGGATTCCDGF